MTDAVKKAKEALRPFKLLAELARRSEPGASEMINVNIIRKCAEALAALEQAGEPVDSIAQAIYEMNPCGEQPTDLDGRPTGPGAEIPWSDMIEYDPEYHAACIEAAKKISPLPTLQRLGQEFDAGEARLHYSGDVMEAVQQLLERGRATLDGEGYLVANPPQSREPSLTHNSVQIIDGPCDHKWASMTVTGHMSCINCRQTRPMTALEAAQLTTPQSRGQAFDGEVEAVPYPRPAIWEVHEKDCEAMRRPRADCTCGPTLMEICPDCSGAGGDNNVSTCARCNGSGGAALSSAKRGEGE